MFYWTEQKLVSCTYKYRYITTEFHYEEFIVIKSLVLRNILSPPQYSLGRVTKTDEILRQQTKTAKSSTTTYNSKDSLVVTYLITNLRRVAYIYESHRGKTRSLEICVKP
jgi:hypothetical protein